MDTSLTKTSLLEAMRAGRQAWETCLAPLDESTLQEPGVEGTFSIKDILAHVAGYEQYAAALLLDHAQPARQAQAALDSFYQNQLDLYRLKQPDFPAQLNDVNGDQLNVLFIAARQSDTARQVWAFEQQSYVQLLSATEAMSEAELVAPSTSGGRPLIEILPNQSYGHYQMHLPAIVRWLEQRRPRPSSE